LRSRALRLVARRRSARAAGQGRSFEDQPGEGPRGEQPLSYRLGRHRRHDDALSLAPTGLRVPASAVQNGDDAHLPVDLGGGLFAEGLIGCPAVRAEPLVLAQVVEHLFGLECRVVPPAMPGAARPLTTTATPVALGPARTWRLLGGVRPGGLGLLLPLWRGTKAELGERRDLLCRRVELTFEIDDSRLRDRQLFDESLLVRGKASRLRPPTIQASYKPPMLTIVLGLDPHVHQHTRWGTLCPVPSVTWANGFTERLPWCFSAGLVARFEPVRARPHARELRAAARRS